MRRAKTDSLSWNYFIEIDPDLALLQEVNEIPRSIKDQYDYRYLKARKQSGEDQRFGNAVLVKGEIEDDLSLSSEIQWVKDEINFFSGNLLSCVAKPTGQDPIKVVSAYSPAWPIDKERLNGIDVSGVKLDDNPDVWLTEILWCGLKNAQPQDTERWIVAGDLNSSETFDVKWGPRGNKQVMDRMKDLGFYECLRGFQKELTPTFRHSSGDIEDQLDHLFVTKSLSDELIESKTGDSSRVFDNSLSDHLPIIAKFNEH